MLVHTDSWICRYICIVLANPAGNLGGHSLYNTLCTLDDCDGGDGDGGDGDGGDGDGGDGDGGGDHAFLGDSDHTGFRDAPDHFLRDDPLLRDIWHHDHVLPPH